MRVRAAKLLVLVLAVVAPAHVATAQGTAQSQNEDTSIRAAGMGGATTGVGWAEPGPWGNPASLAGTSGIAWLMGNTLVGPGFYGDVKFDSRRLLAGGEGLGFTFMGKPGGVGSTKLDYGTSEGTDPFGNPVSTDVFEKIEGWGFGVSPVQVLDFLRARRGDSGLPWSQRADLSFGYQQKDTQVSFGPSFDASAANWDWGLMGSVAVLPGDTEGRESRVEVGAGYAVLNADDNSLFDFGIPLQAPSTRMERLGFSTHATLPFGGAHQQGGSAFDWWEATVPRTVELGFAYDLENRSVGSSGPKEATHHYGFEARLMGILAARTGFVDPPHSDFDGWSFGFGVHLPIGPWAGVGYDWAQVPTPEGIDEIRRHGFAFWLHPVVLWKNARQ